MTFVGNVQKNVDCYKSMLYCTLNGTTRK